MKRLNKLENQIFAGMLGVQLVLMLTVDGAFAAIAPPLLAGVPIGVATLRSEQTVRRMGPKLKRAYLCIAILAAIVAASFIFAGHDLSFRFQMVRALAVDGVALWLATAVAVHVTILRRRQTTALG